MKSYLLFTYYAGQPLGGIKDFLDSFDTLDDALDSVLPERMRYYQIVDRETLSVVKEGLGMFKNFTADCFQKEGSSFEAQG